MSHLVTTYAGVGVAPQVLDATATTPTRVRVRFTEPMDPATLNDPADYTITEDVGSDPRTVIAIASIETSAVVLTLDGVLTPGVNNYNVAVALTVTDVAGNALDAAADNADFNGFNTAALGTALEIGLLAGITSAIGDEITDIAGLRSTRLTAQMSPETDVQSGVASATSVDAGITITFPPGTIDTLIVDPGHEFRLSGSSVLIDTDAGSASSGENRTIEFNGYLLTLPDLVVGDIFRIDSGEWEDLEIEIEELISNVSIRLVVDPPDLTSVDWSIIRRHAIILSVDSAQQITLDGVGLGGNITNESWEIVHLGDTVANVESTFRWDSSGEVFIEDVWYRYTGTTPTTLTGLSHYDGVRFVPGASRLHEPLTEVIDYTRNMSAIDAYRRSFLVQFATGEDLNILARNLGVKRPPGLSSDTTFRELVKVVAYSHRGTRTVVLNALDVLFGVGGYEIFEDLTGLAAVGSELNHTCTVYVRRANNNEEVSVGKTFVDGLELRPLDSTTQVTLGATPLRVTGVTLAPEPGLLGTRIIATGTGVNITGGNTITDPAAGFAARIRRGDVFIVTSGPYSGERATILTAAAATITVCDSTAGESGVPVFTFSAATITNVSYTIVRPISNFRFYRPSEEQYIVDDAGAAVTQWTFTSGTAENATTTLVADHATGGDYFAITDPGAADTAFYTHALRVLPESRVSFSFHISWGGTLSAAATSFNQISFRLIDGERAIAVGLRDAGGGDAEVAFVDISTGQAIAGASTGTIPAAAPWQTFEIVKLGRDRVFLLQNGTEIAAADYTDFAASTDRVLRFGCMDSTLTGLSCLIKHADWSCTTPRDLWNVWFANGQTGATPAQRRLIDGDAGGFFQAGDVGRRVRIHDFTTRNTSGVGNLLGEWEIDSFVSADEVSITGVRQIGGYFERHTPNRMTVRGDLRAFQYPNNVGHDVEILAPHPDAGTYTIDRFLVPGTFERIDSASGKYSNTENTLAAAGNNRGALSAVGADPIAEYTNVIEVVDAGDPPPFTGVDTEADWRLVPNMDPQDSGPFTFELCDAGSQAAAVLTFRQDLAAFGIAAGEIVAVQRSRVLTGQVLDSEEVNVFSSPDYSHFPFYLFDNTGSAAEVMELLLAAGVIPEFDKLFRDSAGLHILN